MTSTTLNTTAQEQPTAAEITQRKKDLELIDKRLNDGSAWFFLNPMNRGGQGFFRKRYDALQNPQSSEKNFDLVEADSPAQLAKDVTIAWRKGQKHLENTGLASGMMVLGALAAIPGCDAVIRGILLSWVAVMLVFLIANVVCEKPYSETREEAQENGTYDYGYASYYGGF